MTHRACSAFLLTTLAIALAGCSTPVPAGNQAAQNADTPGWTGRTVVIGSNSTVAGNAEATYEQQKWGVGRQR